MIRVLLSLALVALATTSALAKPKVAILGLEVTGTVDQAGTNVARDLTDGMRQRAKVGSGPYALAANSELELIDEKVIKQCETEEASCMSEIGKDIDTDVLVYGKLEKDGGGFQATIVMLDVKKRTTIKTTFVAVPPGASSETVRNIAKKTYLELAPTASGTAKLVVTANVESGNVFVDDDLRDTLTDGRVTLTMPEGRYRIAVESEGYKRKEITVKLSEDDSATESFELTKKGGGGGGGGGFDPWKPIFGVLAVSAIGLGLYSTVSWVQSWDPDLSDAERIAIAGDRTTRITQDYCDQMDNDTRPETGAKFHRSCSKFRTHKKFAFIAGGVGAVALVAGYFAFIHEGKKEPSSSAQNRTRKPSTGRSIAITPDLSPEGAGATLRIDW